jgi:ribosome-binding ATPase YchF (GTP1/OBG family)
MKIVITGLPFSGQQQLFSVLTKILLDTISQKPLEVQKGICEVRDPRVAQLVKIYNPKKTVYAKIEYDLLPDFNLQGPAKTLVFNELRNADEICWVQKALSAKEDIDAFVSELVISDMVLVEKRLETIEKDQKKKFQDAREKEKNLMIRCKKLLDEGKRLSGIETNDEENRLIRTYQFLTLKPLITVLDLPEGKTADAVSEQYLKDTYKIEAISLCAELEEQISRLKEEERSEFMKELGIGEPAADKMTRMVFSGLGLMTFFTVGEDEVRAWPVKSLSSAVEAAGAVHTDMAKGFVRAEMFKYDDLIAAGSEAKLKETGKFHLKGRDYIVGDGDILSFRFNV